MIFNLVSRQVIIGISGNIIDIQHEAIHRAMDLYGIRDKRDCFEKVIDLFNKYQTAVEEKGKILSEQQYEGEA